MGLNLRDRDKRKAPDRANWAEVGGFCGPDENPYRAAYLQFQGSGREYLLIFRHSSRPTAVHIATEEMAAPPLISDRVQ